MNNKDKAIAFLQAFISIWAFESLAGIGAQNIIGVVFLAALYMLYVNEMRYSKETQSILSLITSAVFGFLYTFYNYDEIKEQYDNRLFQVVVLLVVFSGLFFLFYHSVNAVYTWYRSGEANHFMFQNVTAIDSDKGNVSRIKHLLSQRVFLVSFILCIIFWLPGYLYEYPGIITPDSINQIEQTLGLVSLSNHHPIAHTLLIGICLRPVYAITGNINTAIGFYTLVQMILMALIVAYSMNTLKLIGLKIKWVYLALAFFALIPFQWVYMVTVWKDVLFAGFIMLFSASFIRVFVKGEDGIKIYNLIIHFIACVGAALYRSNGLYAFILMIPFMCVWCFKVIKYRKRMLITWGLSLITILVIRFPVMSAFGVVQADFVESLSIPIQLFCRVLVEDKDLGAEDTQMVDKIIDTTYIHELYAYDFADNMKELFKAGDPEYLEEHIWEYAGLWVRTGLKYPGLYIDEYKNMTYGYWYPDNPKGEDNYVVAENDGVCDNALGIERKWLIWGLPANIWLKTREIGIKLADMLPGYGILYCMGSTFFLLCISIGIILSKKKRGIVMPLLLTFFGVCTVLIATPVAADFRYTYFLTMMIPFIIVLPAITAKE